MVARAPNRVMLALRVAEARDRLRLRGVNITCSAGCSACCHQWIGAFYLEAQAAVDEAERIGFGIDKNALTEQVALALKPGITRRDWFGTPCVFLMKNNRCAVYRSRPLVCRALHVVSEPARCSDPDGTVTRVDNGTLWRYAADALASEHVQLAMAPVVAALPLMVNLVLSDLGPGTLGKTVGVFGIENPNDCYQTGSP